MSLVLYFALAYWWGVSERVNSQFLAEIPYRFPLAFAVLALAWRWVSRSIVAERPERNSRSNSLRCVASVLVGTVCCIFVSLLCFQQSGLQVEDALADSRRAGIESQFSVFAFVIYLAVAEEVAFRGLLQARISSWWDGRYAVIPATFVFVGMHVPNDEFSEMWLSYLVASLIFGVLMLQFNSLVAAASAHVCVNIAGMLGAGLANQNAGYLRSTSLELLSVMVAVGLGAAFVYSTRLWRHNLPSHRGS